ncbi:MAG: 50S ribosomal protein L4 [Phycisphaeraceae bacterium]|nr:50S ribosomal protein L4 [Phycisphaeraceae bacterium]
MIVPVINMKGSEVGKLTINEQDLGGQINASLIKQAYVRYHANTRQGSSKTKNRHEVEGSTRKLYKQKGTGSARHGDRKANIFRGGGHGHSKKKVREDFRLDMPKKMRRKANRNALLAKLVDNEVRVIDSMSFAEPKTRAFVDFLSAIKVDRSALVAINATNDNARRSAKNVQDVKVCNAGSLNCFDLLNHRYLVIAKQDLEAWLGGPSSQTTKVAKVSPMGREAAPAAPAANRRDPRRKEKA